MLIATIACVYLAIGLVFSYMVFFTGPYPLTKQELQEEPAEWISIMLQIIFLWPYFVLLGMTGDL